MVAAVVQLACTPVDDFGQYWDKGFVDAALEGSWKKVAQPGVNPNDVPGADVLRFTRNGTSYSFQGINPIDPTLEPDVIAQIKAANEERLSARTLRIGKSLFLMERDPAGTGKNDGVMVRYEVRRGRLREYWINNGDAVDFLKAKHPSAKNIRKNDAEGNYVVIKSFDDEVFQVLSEIAENPNYWFLICEYKKVP
jgi:hypothetical protein